MGAIDAVRYQKLCIDKSLELLTKAQEDPKNHPSRPSHIATVFLSGLGGSFFITGRLFEIASNIVKIFVIPFSAPVGQGLNFLCYRVIRLFVLDPLNFLSEIAVTVIRVMSAILGIILPSLGIAGFIAAESILSFNIDMKDAVREYLTTSDPAGMTEPKVIEPRGAFLYLSEDIAKELRVLNYEEVTTKLENSYKEACDIAKISYLAVSLVPGIENYECAGSQSIPTVWSVLKTKLNEDGCDRKAQGQFKKIVEGSIFAALNPNRELSREQNDVDTHLHNEIKSIRAHLLLLQEKFQKDESERKREADDKEESAESKAVNVIKEQVPRLDKVIEEYNSSLTEKSGFSTLRVYT